jgi:hypothetical protein
MEARGVVIGTCVTLKFCDTDAPPNDAVIGATMVPPVARVDTVKVVVVEPAGTVTLAGTVTGSFPVNVTNAPPAGAAAVRVTVAVTVLPPTTVEALRASDRPAGGAAVTVSCGETAFPFSDAVIVMLPDATAVIVKVPVVAPAATVTDAGTVATAALLLDSETMEPPAGAAAPTVTVPWTVAPATTLVVPSDTPDTATVVTGTTVWVVGVVLDPPHCAVASVAATTAASDA